MASRFSRHSYIDPNEYENRIRVLSHGSLLYPACISDKEQTVRSEVQVIQGRCTRRVPERRLRAVTEVLWSLPINGQKIQGPKDVHPCKKRTDLNVLYLTMLSTG